MQKFTYRLLDLMDEMIIRVKVRSINQSDKKPALRDSESRSLFHVLDCIQSAKVYVPV